MISFRLYVVWSSSIIFFASYMHAMRVEHPTDYTLAKMMLKQIASHPELRDTFYEGSAETSALDDADTTYIAESLRKRTKMPIYTNNTPAHRCYTAGTFNPHGSSIALGLNQGLLETIEPASEKKFLAIAEGLNPVIALSYSLDDKYIVSIDRNHTIRVCNIDDGVLIATYDNLALPAVNGVRAATLSADASLIARQNSEYATQLWKIGENKLTLQNTLPTNTRARQLCLSPDACQLFIVNDAFSDLYNLTTGALLFRQPFHLDNATFSGDGAWIVAACKHDAFFNYVRTFSTEYPSSQPDVRTKFRVGPKYGSNSITALATNSDCTRVAVHIMVSGVSTYRLNIMNTQTKPPTVTHSFASFWRASKLILSADETQLAAVGEGSIAVWDLCLKNLVAGLLPERKEFLLAGAPYWARRDQYPIEPTNEHYRYLIRHVAFFKHNLASLFTWIDPTTDDEPPFPKRARHG